MPSRPEIRYPDRPEGVGKINPEGFRVFCFGQIETQATFMAAQLREMMLETLLRYQSLLFELVKSEFSGRNGG